MGYIDRVCWITDADIVFCVVFNSFQTWVTHITYSDFNL